MAKIRWALLAIILIGLAIAGIGYLKAATVPPVFVNRFGYEGWIVTYNKPSKTQVIFDGTKIHKGAGTAKESTSYLSKKYTAEGFYFTGTIEVHQGKYSPITVVFYGKEKP